MKITKKILDGYKHIYALNGFSISTRQNSLYKYMCFEPLIKSVASNELVFVSPMKWKDPFERRFFRTDYTSLNFIRPEIACMCLTSKSTTNEEASWKMYVAPNDKALRITYDYTVFCDFLERYAEENNCKIYIGKVIYKFDKKEIEALHKPEQKNRYYSTFFSPDFDVEHYLSLMLIKRKSFAFENEVRVFIVNESKLNLENDLLQIKNINYQASKLISQVMIAPFEPLPENDIRTPFRNKINKIESDEYKKILSDAIGCTVKQSLLYANCNPLLRV